jgi:ABC-2 type transport system ATP-binding protein
LFHAINEIGMNEIVIQAKELTKAFGDFIVVDHISFSVHKGEIFGFLGANGAGKTTAIKMLSGLLKPSSGAASVLGFDVYKNSEDIKKNIGYMSQRFSLYEDLTLIENMKFYGGIYGMSKQDIKNKSEEILNLLHIETERNQLVRSLPLGWKQKLAFSISILHDPPLVFLDEPTGGVDPVTRREFWELIIEAAHQGKTIFVTTHYMDEAEYCNKVSIMVDGKIEAFGTTQELKKEFNTTSMENLFLNLARKSSRVEG